MPRHEPARSERNFSQAHNQVGGILRAAQSLGSMKGCSVKSQITRNPSQYNCSCSRVSLQRKATEPGHCSGRCGRAKDLGDLRTQNSDEAPATSALVPRPSPARVPRGVRGAWGAHAAHPGDRAGVKSPPPRLRLPDLGRPGVASGAPRAAATARASSSSPTRVAAGLAEDRSRGFLGLARALSGTTETFQAARSRALPVTRLRRPARRPRSRHGARSAPPPQPRSRRRCPRAHLSSRLVTSLLRLGSAHSDLLNVSASSTLSAMEQVSWNICRMHGWTKDLSSHSRSPSMLEKATDHLLFLTLWTLWRKNNSAFMIVPGNKKPRIRQIG
ncbi:uncharacterized protein LOC116562212 [Sapajus apella]|uniref:Uncharacterized protein LOC116562212 n=1 Tax=Sapajus apella TaxID=9515 RepID=A0A6J3J5U1_SAPAP|nr:uncharacterized protein LOC116562212 [Sapajus apella]